MDLNPDDAHQYFEGVDYPAAKEDLSSAAKDNGAPMPLWAESEPWAGPSSPARRTSQRSYTLLRSRPDYGHLSDETRCS